MSREPTRLADLRGSASPEAAFMGEVIRAQRAVRPPAAKMQELAGRLGPLLEQKSPSPFRAMPWLVTSVIAGVLVAGAVWVTRPNDGASANANANANASAPTLLPVPSAPAASFEPPLPSPPPPPAVLDAPAISVEALPNANAQHAPAVSAPRCDEVELVERADTRLRSGDPAGALAVAREHEQRCPAGALVQERERIAIEALARLGRADAARARASAFQERFPSSPHLRRVRQVIEELPR